MWVAAWQVTVCIPSLTRAIPECPRDECEVIIKGTKFLESACKTMQFWCISRGRWECQAHVSKLRYY